MRNILTQVNQHSDNYILKGGTALLMCYGSTRFSEDIDFDAVGTKKGIQQILDKYGWNYRVAKNTDTVKRYLIHYGGEKPLKIEISYRRNVFDESMYYRHSSGILVYTLNDLTRLKALAFNKRDKIRDLYDVVFICQNYWQSLCNENKKLIVDSFCRKGIDYYEYISETQQNEFINNEALGYAYLEVLDKLGIT